MFAIAGALLGLILLLATLQYRWLGQISGAERERMTATLNTRATAFAQDFDRELTRAYLLFQIDPMSRRTRAIRRRQPVRHALRPLAGDGALPEDDQGRLRLPQRDGDGTVGTLRRFESRRRGSSSRRTGRRRCADWRKQLVDPPGWKRSLEAGQRSSCGRIRVGRSGRACRRS